MGNTPCSKLWYLYDNDVITSSIFIKTPWLHTSPGVFMRQINVLWHRSQSWPTSSQTKLKCRRLSSFTCRMVAICAPTKRMMVHICTAGLMTPTSVPTSTELKSKCSKRKSTGSKVCPNVNRPTWCGWSAHLSMKESELCGYMVSVGKMVPPPLVPCSATPPNKTRVLVRWLRWSFWTMCSTYWIYDKSTQTLSAWIA